MQRARSCWKSESRKNFISHQTTSGDKRKSPASIFKPLNSETLSHVCGSDFFFFPLRWNQARTTQSPSHYLLLPLATSFSKLDCLASPVVSWKRVTSSQNSLQSRKNGTTFILRYHILQSKLRVSFLAASTINFPTLSKQQERGQQREPSLQKSTRPSQSWVHFIGVSSGGDYLLPDPQNILCSVLSLLFYISSTVTIPSKVLSHFSDRGMSGHSWEKWSSCLWLGFLLECEIGLTFLKGQVVS